MATNPLIALQTQAPAIENPLDVLRRVQATRAGEMQNHLAALELGEKKKQIDLAEKLRTLMSVTPRDTSVQGRNELLQSNGFWKEADALQKADLERQNTQAQIGERNAQAGLHQTKALGDRMGLIGQAMSGVQGPEDYAQRVQQLGQMLGPEAVAGLPQQYDPRAIEGIRQQALTVQQQVQAQQAQAQLAETGRHNLAAEATARGQLGVAQGQLGVARQNAGIAGANLGLRRQELELKGKELAAGGKPPSGYMHDPNQPGRLIAIPGGPADEAGKPLTDAQSKAVLFGGNAGRADGILADMAGQGVNMPSVIKKGLEQVPLVGNALGAVANTFVPSSKQQQVEQAQRQFANAILRRESGAAISASEFDNANKQYFPQIGEGPGVIAQKAAARKAAVDGILAEVPRSKRGDVLAPMAPAQPAAIPGMPAPQGGAPAGNDPLGLRRR